MYSDKKLDFDDVLLVPQYSKVSSRSEVNLIRKFKFNHSKQTLECIPIIAANMDGIGTISMAKELSKRKILTTLTKITSVEEEINIFKEIQNDPELLNYTMLSCGVSEDDFTILKRLYNKIKFKMIRFDIPHAYSLIAVNAIKRLRETFPDVTIFAGNVVTVDACNTLYEAGADVIIGGIGSGAFCTTRLKTGFGYPQFSMINEICDEYTHAFASDGGCVHSGDIVKAYSAGADFVVLGSMLSGHYESEMNIIQEHGEEFITHYGMSSETANNKHFGGLKGYRTSEGREVKIPYKGKVENTINDILGGIRSACSYNGVSDISKLIYNDYITVNNTHNRSLTK